MPRKRKSYPPARTANKPAPRPGAGPEPAVPRPTVVQIDPNAGKGRADLSVGDRVRIGGTGLLAGETGVIEKIAAGAIPSAVVRTDAGRVGHVRATDLQRVTAEA